MAVSDRWHKSRPKDDEPRCEHNKVPTSEHGIGDRWLVRWRDEAGKQCKRSFTKKTQADAFDAKVRDQLNTGTYIDPSAGKVTFRSFAEEWRRDHGVDPVTAELIENRLNLYVYPALGGQQMVKLSKRPAAIKRWIRGLEGKLSPSTIRGVVSLVSTVFADAIENGIVAANPCSSRSVKPPKVIRPQVVPWTLAQVEAVAAALPERYAALPILGAGCGMRQGELFGIAEEDINWLGRMVHVQRQVRIVGGKLVFSLPKGGKVRDVPLPEHVSLRLSHHIAEHGTSEITLPWKGPDGKPAKHELLFTRPSGLAVERNAFNKLWRVARIDAGIADTRDNGCHVLRHTFASATLAAGVDIRTLAEYLGHSDPAFTLRVYAHLMPDADDRARKALDAFFSQSSAQSVPGAVL